jgi:hypothetical protein
MSPPGSKPPKANAMACPQLAKADVASLAHPLVNRLKPAWGALRLMPLPNRVDPFVNVFADSSRGLFMGNRGGRFHRDDDRTLGKRRWVPRTSFAD